MSSTNTFTNIMVPTYNTVPSQNCRRSYGKAVGFVHESKIHTIPSKQSSWQPGEYADNPTAYEVNNATMLSNMSLATATAEERYDMILEKSLVTTRPRLIRARDSLTLRPQSTRSPDPTSEVITPAPTAPPNQKAFPDFSKAIKCKPVPSRAVTTPFASKFVEDFSASFRPELIRITTTTSDFADFLPAHKVLTWDNMEKDEAELRRSRSVAGLTSRGLKVAKSAVYKVKVGKK